MGEGRFGHAAVYLDDDPDTDPFALMEGKRSRHTGWLKSAGMLIPMGYLIGNGWPKSKVMIRLISIP